MIVIIDYGMANLRSVQKGLERAGHQSIISGDPDQVAQAEKLVLPGVGAFRDAIAQLRAAQLVEPIREAIDADRPLLGICLGLQLLFEVSWEGGRHEGLGVLGGQVARFEVPPPMKVPHMGWNQVHQCRTTPLWQDITDQSHFYFVHSYYVIPDDADVIVGQTDYGPAFCSAICRGRLMATQFHPEKSQSVGLQLLRNFGRL